jgi:hypothetical protein
MSPSDEVANWEIFLWALYQLGGSSQFVDIEDVSLLCFKIAPARFGWRTKPDLPDYKKCAKALQEAEARRPRMLVKTGDSFGRQLTAAGQRWIEANTKHLSQVLQTGVPVAEPKRRPTSRMLAEIERSEAFVLWKDTSTIPQEKWKMADVLRCSPDSSPATWTGRLESAKAVAYFAHQESIVRFLDEVAAAHPEWFGG